MKTLTEPTPDAQLTKLYGGGMAAAEQVALVPGKKYALCLLTLGDGVTPAHYSALKAAVEAIHGIQNIELIVDHQARATLPDGTQLVAVIEMNLRIEPVPVPDPEE